MKKLATILCLSATAIAAFAQGTITMNNGTYSLVRTNATGAGGAAGSTAPWTSGTGVGFYYGVFTAPSTVTTISTSLQDLLTSTWTFTGIYGTNTQIATGGRLQASGGSGAATTAGWPAGVTNSYLILGWSANVAGADWTTVSATLQGATLSGGLWTGGGITNHPNAAGGFLGASSLGYGESGGGSAGLPPLLLFGAGGASGQGVPIGTGWDLFAIPSVPEPSTFALAGLGAAALLIFRRRK